jgi:hypothetical protein
MVARTYEIRLSGLVPKGDLVAIFGDVEAAEHELRTVVSGRFADQAALHGLLQRMRAYGLEVVEVRRVPEAEDRTDAPSEEGDRR